MKFSEFIELIRQWIGFVNAGIILFLFLVIIILSFKLKKLKKQTWKMFHKVNEQQRMINNNIDILDQIKKSKVSKSLFLDPLNVKNDKSDKKIKGKKEEEMIELEKKGKIFQEKVKKVVAKGKAKENGK